MARNVLLLVLLLITLDEKTFSQSTVLVPATVQEVKISTNELREGMNKLWQENSYWSRNLILSMIDSLPGQDQAMWRLIKNQEEICGLMKSYFGEESGVALTELFYSDLNFQIEVIKASVTDSLLAKEAKGRWHKSAGSIADYLYHLNPKWMLKDIKALLNAQVDLTYETLRQRIFREYDLEVVSFDKMISNGNKISRLLTQGIIFQYPQSFTDTATRITAVK